MFDLKLRELEKEYKFLISKDLFSRIDVDINWQQEYEQVNYYFLDNMGVLVRNNITVRVRNLNNCYKLQVKIPLQNQGFLSLKNEYEYMLDELPDKILGTDISKTCGIDLSDLSCIGTLTTLRKTYHLSQSAKLCLDYNRYLGTEDYEVEIEVIGECKLNNFIKKYELDSQFNNSVGKFSRFMNRYREIRGHKNAE